jgi:hypothetical protein
VDECKPLIAGGGLGAHQLGGVLGGGRGLYSFPIQLNLSSSVHYIPSLPHEYVLELLKLSSNVNECKPLGGGDGAVGGESPNARPRPRPRGPGGAEPEPAGACGGAVQVDTIETRVESAPDFSA